MRGSGPDRCGRGFRSGDLVSPRMAASRELPKRNAPHQVAERWLSRYWRNARLTAPESGKCRQRPGAIGITLVPAWERRVYLPLTPDSIGARGCSSRISSVSLFMSSSLVPGCRECGNKPIAQDRSVNDTTRYRPRRDWPKIRVRFSPWTSGWGVGRNRGAAQPGGHPIRIKGPAWPRTG